MKGPGLIVFLLFSSILLRGQCLTDIRKLLPDRSNGRDLRWSKVATGGDYMVLTNFMDDTTGYYYAGAAYLFKKSPAGWDFKALLKPSNPKTYLQFATGVSIDSLGETIAFTSYGSLPGTTLSEIYIFQKPATEWSTMVETERIKLPDTTVSMTSVKLSSDGLAVIANGGVLGPFIIERANKTLPFSSITPHQLIPSVSSQNFGVDISIDKNFVAVSCENEIDPVASLNVDGSISIFKRSPSDNYPMLAKLRVDAFASPFARSFKMKGDLIISPGVYKPDVNSPVKGVLYIFQKKKNKDWRDSDRALTIPFPDFNAGIEILDSTTLAYASDRSNFSAISLDSTYFGVVRTISKTSYSWVNPKTDIIYKEALPKGYTFWRNFGSSISWNGSQLVVCPSMDKAGANFANSVTSLTRSNGIWGSVVKNKPPEFNSYNFLFGYSFARSANDLIISSPKDSEIAPYAGAVEIFSIDNNHKWVRTGKILPPWFSDTEESWGNSIAATDSLLAVGATNYGPFNKKGFISGEVYLYKRTGPSWSSNQFFQKILAPDTITMNFGYSIGLSSKVMAVAGLQNASTNAVVIYENVGGRYIYSQIIDFSNVPYAQQNSQVTVRSDTVFIFSGNSFFRATTGVFIIAKDAVSKRWGISTRLDLSVPSTTVSTASLVVGRNNIFVGIPTLSRGDVPDVGGVLVYTKLPGTAWPSGTIQPSTIIYPKDTIANGLFGYSLSNTENTLVVGAPGSQYVLSSNGIYNDLRNKAGAAYIFTAQDYYWKNTTQLLKLEGTEYNKPLSDHMGLVVSSDYDFYYSSAPDENNDHGALAGAVYTIPTPPLVKLMAPVCSQSAPLKLFGYPFGGTWSGPGLVSGSNGTFDPQLVGTGKYLLTYKTPNCTYEGKLLIEVLPSPSATLASAANLIICPTNPPKISVVPLDSATYQWYYQSFSKNSLIAISGQTSWQLTVGLSGYYYCNVTKGGCSASSAVVTVNYETPSTSIGPQEVVCNINKTILLKASPPGGTWKGNGISNASAGVFNPSGLLNGKYPVTYSFTSQLGCKYSLADTVLVDTIPQIKLNRVPGDFCLTGLVTLQGTPTVKHLKYRWKYKASNQSTWLDVDTISLAKRNFVESGYYESVVSNAHCQAKTDSLQVGLLNDLPLTLTPNDSIVQVCLDPTVTLSVSSNRNDASFTWFMSDSIQSNFIRTGDGESISVSKNGFYKVKAEIGFCESESKLKYVKFLPHDSIWVPNVFTPNGDALNPNFKISGNVNNYSLVILNRWGQEIHTANQNDKPWDGEDHPTGTYYWFVEYRDCRNQQKTAQGFVQIIR